jgi:hypothetical protein
MAWRSAADLWTGAVLVCVVGIGGCGLTHPTPAGEIRAVVEPQYENPYVLYRPTTYHNGRAWPVIVLCPTQPWQSAESVVTKWSTVAEDEGVILVGVKLGAAASSADPDSLREDESRVLAALQHARAGSIIDADRVFIAGDRYGARVAAYVGIRNPNVFRLVGLIAPHFEPSDLVGLESHIDPHQRVLVIVAMGDLFKSRSEAVIEWLRGRRSGAREVRSAARPVKFPGMAQQFFARTSRAEPWIRIGAFRTADPLQVRFQVLAAVDKIESYRWDFGDGRSSTAIGPLHTFAEAGEYAVELEVHARRDVHRRRIMVQVP